jgi:hypothetical protein
MRRQADRGWRWLSCSSLASRSVQDHVVEFRDVLPPFDGQAANRRRGAACRPIQVRNLDRHQVTQAPKRAMLVLEGQRGETMKTAFRALMALVLMLAATYAAAHAYPVKSVRVTFTFPLGGSTDAIARILSPQLAERLGQPFVVENRPGGLAGGTIGADYVAKSPPDSCTLLVFGGGSLSLGIATAVNTPHDPVKSFASTTPEEFANFIVSEIPRWSKVAKDSGQKFD